MSNNYFILSKYIGHWEVVRLLLDNESDIEHRNKAGCTPLMLASRYFLLSYIFLEVLHRKIFTLCTMNRKCSRCFCSKQMTHPCFVSFSEKVTMKRQLYFWSVELKLMCHLVAMTTHL